MKPLSFFNIMASRMKVVSMSYYESLVKDDWDFLFTLDHSFIKQENNNLWEDIQKIYKDLPFDMSHGIYQYVGFGDKFKGYHQVFYVLSTPAVNLRFRFGNIIPKESINRRRACQHRVRPDISKHDGITYKIIYFSVPDITFEHPLIQKMEAYYCKDCLSHVIKKILFDRVENAEVLNHSIDIINNTEILKGCEEIYTKIHDTVDSDNSISTNILEE